MGCLAHTSLITHIDEYTRFNSALVGVHRDPDSWSFVFPADRMAVDFLDDVVAHRFPLTMKLLDRSGHDKDQLR